MDDEENHVLYFQQTKTHTQKVGCTSTTIRQSQAWLMTDERIQKTEHLTVVRYFCIYTLGHVLLPLAYALAVIAVPLFPATPGFSTNNLSFLLVHSPLIGILPPIYQFCVYTHFCKIKFGILFKVWIGLYGMMMILPALIPCFMNAFPVPLLYVVWGSAIFGSADLVFLYLYPKLAKFDDIEAKRVKGLFKKFVYLSMGASGLFGLSVVYLFAYAYVKSNVGQVFLQIGYNACILLCKEALFRFSGRDNTLTYWAELTSNFFTALALPSIYSYVPFLLHAIFDVVGAIYQITRLTDFWYKHVELRYITIMNKFFSWMSIDGPLTNNQNFIRESNCRTMLMIAFAKTLSPLMFLVFFLFGTLSYNKQYFPWRNTSAEVFNNTINFAIILFAVAVVAMIVSLVVAIKQFHLGSVVIQLIFHTKENFWYYCGLGCGVMVFPLAMILEHENTWFFFNQDV